MTTTTMTTERPAHCFDDCTGRRWELKLTIGLAGHINDQCKVDFVDVLEERNTALRQLSASDALFVRVLWLMCEDSAAEQNVDEVAFGRGLDGDALGNAMLAMMEAIVNFTLPVRRVAVRAMLDKVMQVQSDAASRVATKSKTPEFERSLKAAMDKAERSVFAAMSTAGR